MKILKMVGFVFVAIVALTVFGKVRQKMAANSDPRTAQASNPKDPGLSPQGFFLMTRDEAKKPTVTVFVAPNCPSFESQRARDLMASIQSAGIPCEEKQGIELSFNNPDDMARMQKYASAIQNPLVMVRGWGKGNPSAEQVIAEYRSKN